MKRLTYMLSAVLPVAASLSSSTCHPSFSCAYSLNFLSRPFVQLVEDFLSHSVTCLFAHPHSNGFSPQRWTCVCVCSSSQQTIVFYLCLQLGKKDSGDVHITKRRMTPPHAPSLATALFERSIMQNTATKPHHNDKLYNPR